MADFKVGETVGLKSGGPVMTVTEVGDEYGTLKVFCTWFDDKGKQERSSFEPETLQVVEV